MNEELEQQLKEILLQMVEQGASEQDVSSAVQVFKQKNGIVDNTPAPPPAPPAGTQPEQPEVEAKPYNPSDSAVDADYWDPTKAGGYGKLLADNGFTRDDIAVDENGQYTIGGQTEIMATGAWRMANMGMPVKEGVNYGAGSTLLVNDMIGEGSYTSATSSDGKGMLAVWNKEEKLKKVISKQQQKHDEDPTKAKQQDINSYWEESEFNKTDYNIYENGDIAYNGQIVAGPNGDVYSKEHKESIKVINSQVEVDEANLIKDKVLGRKKMPKITKELIDKDDSDAIDDLNTSWSQYGFTFRNPSYTSETIEVTSNVDLDGDGVKDKKTFAFEYHNKDAHEQMDKWMRDRAVDAGSMLDAHLESVGITKDERDGFNANNTETYNRSIAPVTGEDGSQVDPPQVGSWQYENEFLPRLRVNGMDTQFETAMRMVAEENFVNNLKHEDGTPYTEEEKQNYKITKQDRDFLAYPSVDDPRVKELTIGLMNNSSEAGSMRERIAESIENMDGGWFAMSDPQKLLEERAKERYHELKDDQKQTLQQAKQVNDRYTANLTQLKEVTSQLNDFDFKGKMDKLKGDGFKSQEEADAAQAKADAFHAEYKDLYSKYEDLSNNHKTLFNLSNELGTEIQELGLNASDLDIYREFVGDNHQLGTQMGLALGNAAIDLVQGVVGAVEMVYDAADEGVNYLAETISGDPVTQAYLRTVGKLGFNMIPGSGGFNRLSTASEGEKLSLLDKLNAAIDGRQAQWSEGVQGPQEFGSINSAADFGEWFGVMLAGQVPNLALMASTGGASLYVMGASSAGAKYGRLKEQDKLYRESGGLYGISHSFPEMFINASLTGVAEALSEKITLGQMGAAKKTFLEIFEDVGVRGGVRQYISKVMFDPKNLRAFGKDLLEEGGSEAVATIAENFLDISSGDTSVGLFDGVPESFASGVAISGSMKSPQLFKHAVSAFRSRDALSVRDVNFAKIEKLQDQLLDPNITKEVESRLTDQIAELVLETTEILETDIKRIDLLTNDDKKNLFTVESDNRKLTKAFREVEADESLSEDEKQLQYNAINEKYAKNQAVKQEILDKWPPNVANESYAKDVEGAKTYAKAIEKASDGKVKVNITEGTSDDFDKFLDTTARRKEWRESAKKEIDRLDAITTSEESTPAEKAAAEEAANKLSDLLSNQPSEKFEFGVHVPIFGKDGKVTGHEVFINSETTNANGVYTTAAHEFVHTVLYNTIKNDSTVSNALSEALMSEVEASGVKFDRAAFNERIGQYPPGKQGEETLTILTEMLLDNELNFNDGFWVKLGDIIRQAITRAGLGGNVKFDSGTDVKNFLKDYAKSIDKNYADRRIVKMAVEGAKGKLLDKKGDKSKKSVAPDYINNKINEANFSKTVKNALDSDPDLASEFDKYLIKRDGSRITTKDEFVQNPREFGQAYSAIMEGRALDGTIHSTAIQLKLELDGAAKREFTRKVKENLAMRFVANFDPAKNESIFGWLAGKNGVVQYAIQDVKKEFATTVPTDSIDNQMGDGEGTFAENLVGEDSEGLISTGRPERDEISSDELTKVQDDLEFTSETQNEISETIKSSDIDISLVEGFKGTKTEVMGVAKVDNGKGGLKTPSKVKDVEFTGKASGVLKTVAEWFGIVAEKIPTGQTLSQGERGAVLDRLVANAPAILKNLPEQHNRNGKATGVQKVLLESELYEEGYRGATKEATAAGDVGMDSQGLKIYRHANNLDEVKLMRVLGVDGKMVDKKFVEIERYDTSTTKYDSILKAMVSQVATLAANQELRTQAIENGSHPMNIISEFGDGKNQLSFSKSPKNTVGDGKGKYTGSVDLNVVIDKMEGNPNLKLNPSLAVKLLSENNNIPIGEFGNAVEFIKARLNGAVPLNLLPLVTDVALESLEVKPVDAPVETVNYKNEGDRVVYDFFDNGNTYKIRYHSSGPSKYTMKNMTSGNDVPPNSATFKRARYMMILTEQGQLAASKYDRYGDIAGYRSQTTTEGTPPLAASGLPATTTIKAVGRDEANLKRAADIQKNFEDSKNANVSTDQANSSIDTAADGSNMDGFKDINFSKKHRDSYVDRLISRRYDMDKNLANGLVDAVFNFLDSANIPDNKKSKFEKLAFHYTLNGNLNLPQDGEKLIEVERLSTAKKIDPFSVKNPNEITERFAGKTKEQRVNPDSVPEFSNKRTLANGVTTYTVDNSKMGQAATRRIVNSHYGPKSNPWCITQMDTETGELTDDSWEAWSKSYGGKAIAFKDGKLVSFGVIAPVGEALTDQIDSENVDQNKMTWFDRTDLSAPIGEMPGNTRVDENGIKLFGTFNIKNGEVTKTIMYGERGNQQDGKYEYFRGTNLSVPYISSNHKDGKLNGEKVVTSPKGSTTTSNYVNGFRIGPETFVTKKKGQKDEISIINHSWIGGKVGENGASIEVNDGTATSITGERVATTRFEYQSYKNGVKHGLRLRNAYNVRGPGPADGTNRFPAVMPPPVKIMAENWNNGETDQRYQATRDEWQNMTNNASNLTVAESEARAQEYASLGLVYNYATDGGVFQPQIIEGIINSIQTEAENRNKSGLPFDPNFSKRTADAKNSFKKRGPEKLSRVISESVGATVTDATVDIDTALSGLNPDGYLDISFSKKHRDQYEKQLAKKRGNLKSGDIKGAVDSIFNWVDSANIPENKKSKFEKVALHYLVNGNLILPQDGGLLIEAERIAEQHGLDMFASRSFNEIIENYVDKSKGKMLDPDSFLESGVFHSKKTLAGGVTVYKIQDSAEDIDETAGNMAADIPKGQRAIRDIVDSHWGLKSNPWCVVQVNTLTGKLTPESTRQWGDYNNGKSVAFKDGKLISLGTNPGKNGSQWWARNNEAAMNGEITGYTNKLKNGITVYGSYNEKTGKPNKAVLYGTKGNKQSGAFERWDHPDVGEKGPGNLVKAEVSEYKNGKRNGKTTLFNTDQSIRREVNYTAGVKIGTETSFGNNTTSEVEYSWVGSKVGETGAQVSKSSKNGKTEWNVTNYKEGVKHGIEISNSGGSDGGIVAIQEWKNGELDTERGMMSEAALYADTVLDIYSRKRVEDEAAKAGIKPSDLDYGASNIVDDFGDTWDMREDFNFARKKPKKDKKKGKNKRKEITERELKDALTKLDGKLVATRVGANGEMVVDIKMRDGTTKTLTKKEMAPVTESTDVDVKADKGKKNKKGERIPTKIRKKEDIDLNSMIEYTSGVRSGRKFDNAEGRRAGEGKGRWKFFIPPGADDFAGLMYAFLGKGEQGEAHHQWFKENLFDPFSKGIRNLNRVKLLVANGMKELNRQFPEVSQGGVKRRSKLKTKIKDSDFTYSDAIRVHNWVKAGHKVPGMSPTQVNKLVNIVSTDASLRGYANGVYNINNMAGGVAKPGENWFGGSMQSDTNSSLKLARKIHLAEWTDKKNIIFSKENMNKVEAVHGTRFRDALEGVMWRMENGGNKPSKADREMSAFNLWMFGSIGTTMFMNSRSALLQTLSTVNFLNWKDNNLVKAAAAFANQPQYWKDFALIFNSPFAKLRRSGIQTDINAAEIMNAVSGSKNKVKAAIGWLLKAGFTPTQIMDSFAIAAGGSTMYRNRVKTYLKEGMTQAEAEKEAFENMMEIAEETQQSTREDRVSEQQASGLGKYVLAFQNVTMQYARLIKKASLDLVNGRGDVKSNISKIVYYGAVQNIIFYGLQQAVFTSFFDDEEEDKKTQRKKFNLVNGMLNSLLKGAGIPGAVVATLKDIVLSYNYETSKLDDGEYYTQPEYAETILKALDVAPPLGIKFRNLYRAAYSNKFDKGITDYMDKTDSSNPMWSQMFATIEGITNLPANRLYNKIENIKEVFNDENELWQRIAMFLGWSRWTFSKDKEVEKARAEMKREKADTAEAEKDMEKVAKDVEQQAEVEAEAEGFLLDQQEEREEGKKGVKCAAVSVSGKRCSKKALDGQNYCTIHESAEQNESGEKTQCSHVKPDGKRCKIKTNNKSGKCYYHD
tara:strand:+ start:14977 stop:26877 length:11901 start_codon:yes stop_codon:yes gene_type:complete